MSQAERGQENCERSLFLQVLAESRFTRINARTSEAGALLPVCLIDPLLKIVVIWNKRLRDISPDLNRALTSVGRAHYEYLKGEGLIYDAEEYNKRMGSYAIILIDVEGFLEYERMMSSADILDRGVIRVDD